MRSVLVTGTSTGIGQATAVELARRGWRVFATMRDPEKGGALEQALVQAGARGNAEIGQLDVNDASSIRDAIDRTLSITGGELDAVVHNAGTAVGGAFEDMPENALRGVMETNFFGVLALTRAVLPVFRGQRRGRIAIVSSDSAFFGQPANSIYCASKWAIEGWAEAISYELQPFGIDVVLIEPGPYRTQIWRSERMMRDNSEYGPWLKRLYDAVDHHTHATGRDPKEVGVAIGKALESSRPRFRYPVGPIARLTHQLRGKVPVRTMQKGVFWYLGLRKQG